MHRNTSPMRQSQNKTAAILDALAEASGDELTVEVRWLGKGREMDKTFPSWEQARAFEATLAVDACTVREV